MRKFLILLALWMSQLKSLEILVRNNSEMLGRARQFLGLRTKLGLDIRAGPAYNRTFRQVVDPPDTGDE